MTTSDIAGLCERLRAALEGVTPSRWVSSGTSVEVFRGGTLFTSYRGNGKFEDATFIALSREAVPALLDTIERQAAEIERLRGALVAKADEGMLVLETLAKMTPDRAHRHVREGLSIAREARAALTGEE